MIYYYAHTGHKVGLERARRGLALKRIFDQHNVPMQMLVNDFRAGVALKDEQGLAEYITIETILDIDAVAEKGDSIIIDSDEDDQGKLAIYCDKFDKVWRFSNDQQAVSLYGERIFRPGCDTHECLDALVVDAIYSKEFPKTENVLLFLRDYDHDKTILKHAEFFQAFKMEILLGHYFFVKYEEDMANIFSKLHEPEMYVEMITGSSTVVTASAQAAIEAKASGAKTIYIDLHDPSALYPAALLLEYGISVIEGFDTEALKNALNTENPKETKVLSSYPEEVLLNAF